ncbi:MAG: hypothetical protein ACTSRI_16835 [Promethearchaeota archaeon]
MPRADRRERSVVEERSDEEVFMPEPKIYKHRDYIIILCIVLKFCWI